MPIQSHTDVQPNEIIEKFFLEEIPDPDVPLDQNQGQSVHRVMVQLYGGEFNKPTRQASVDDKDNHPAEWAAFEQKAQEATADMPRPGQGLPPEGDQGPGTEKPDGQPPLGGARAGKPLRRLPLVGERPEEKSHKRPEEGGPSQKRDVGHGENPAGIPGRASPDADSESRDTREFADQQHHQPTPLKGPAQGVGSEQGHIGVPSEARALEHHDKDKKR